MIRVVVADDHAVVREGIAALVDRADDMDVVARVGSGADAIAAVSDHEPDVVLMDLRMPDVDGVAATAAIGAGPGSTRVLILTTFETDEAIVRAVDAGAAGYLLKDTEPELLLDAIRAVARGETVLAPPVAARLMARVRGEHRASLTDRELEILRLVARGASNAEVAASLHIGPATVKTHLVHVFDKLGVNDRTTAVNAAYERGILTPPGV